jgi:hypothetical protein
MTGSNMKREYVAVIQRVDAVVWKELVSVLTKYPTESLHEAKSPKWTSKDVFAHMTRWLKHCNDKMEAYCAGKPLPKLESTPEEMNAKWKREDRDKSLAEVKETAQLEFKRRQRLLDAIPLKKWDEELMQIQGYDGANHFAAHLNYIVKPF